MNKNKTKKKSFFHLILIMIFGAIIGVISSRITRNINLNAIIESFTEKFYIYQVPITFILGFSSIIASMLLFKMGKKKNILNLNNDEETIDEKYLDYAIIIADTFSILLIILYIMGMESITYENIKNLILNTVMIIVFLPVLAVIQNQIVEFIKSYRPEKQGDVYSFKFNKDWLKSSDEREKMEVYEAGYYGYKAIQVAILVIAVITGILAIDTNIGVIPSMTLGIVFLVGKMAYYKAILKNKR